jgi:hypothetical protein
MERDRHDHRMAAGLANHSTGRGRRKFLAAYEAARNEFLTDIATIIGGGVLVMDLEGNATAIVPDKKH